jgi:phosphohistidine phosphatase SixA
MRIVVVRHGHAEPKRGWAGLDVDRPLVARGRRQAERLGSLIGAEQPARVISSPARRCVATVQPVADKAGLTVQLSDQLSSSAGQAAAELCEALVVSEPADSVVVLCTHREVLVQLLPWLSKQFGRNLGHRLPGAKGAAWFLCFRGPDLLTVEYRAPGA